ncbi:hypothetical protein BSU07_07970 [Brucella melitensis]|uniref:Conserved domain protein n=8 Tax=Brucella TaxID=234 RepID=Q2YPL2_BRUA2|nr:conserved domain protein [Brucella suis 1330]AAX73437.1 conserved domain protein [Brucella abortus bv. 1 str. 9-941]ABX61122.1 Hypothetical protein, conserved [Brucella canis ATCC 23365]ABY37127.1 Hypothetical protein, conserved [Brucella suis ATCC 23445]ACN99839.1 Hypothetical protein, conserved [Brucella melitensis ATCC 23457]ACU47037.1 hypothetical protein BMI_I15 [Brucella microti CCM 4915]AEK53341.1 hypothetical protein BPI_I15 [Brucella pinnipedialis B2/94]AEU05053.1 hypothetical pr
MQAPSTRNYNENRLLPKSESLFQKPPCRSANGAFQRSGAHVRSVHSAPVLENHHFRLGLPLFDSDS